MTQAALAGPLSKAFVSAVETGRAVPSLSALRLLVARLGSTLPEFLAGVEEASVRWHLTGGYDGQHEYDSDHHQHDQDPTPGHR